MAELFGTSLLADSNLKAYYRFSAGALESDSKASNTLTNTNTVAETTDGKYGGGADFGSSNTNKLLSRTDFFSIANNGAHSVSLWIKASSEISSGTRGITAWSMSGVNAQFFVYYEYNGGTRRITVGRIRQGIAIDSFSYNTTLGTSWHHLVVTWNASTVAGYLDTVSMGTVSSSGGNAGGGSSFRLGQENIVNSTYWSGYIDDAAVFDKVISSTEIATLFAESSLGSSAILFGGGVAIT